MACTTSPFLSLKGAFSSGCLERVFKKTMTFHVLLDYSLLRQRGGGRSGILPLDVVTTENFSSALVWRAGKAEENDMANVIGSCPVLSQKPIWEWGEAIRGHTFIRYIL